MKNITVSLDDELYRKSRVAAAESDTSVTALVREFLTQFTGLEADSAGHSGADESSQKGLKIIQVMRKRHPLFQPGNRLSREEVHARSQSDTVAA